MRWMMLAILFIVRLAMGYQFQSIASVSTQLVADFGFSYTQVGTLIGLFLLPGVFMAMPSGAMTRAASDKTLLMIGAALMAAGSTAMAMAETPVHLYTGRLLTGVGATIFNLVLTKMVTEWFFGKEIITALSIMLVSWPIGIALGLLTQATIANFFGWSSVMMACTAVTLAALVLTAGAYRAPTGQSAPRNTGPLRFSLPPREAVHISIVGIAWATYNASLILLVSFGPDSLVAKGWTDVDARSAASLMMWATMLSLPLGGRLMEKFGYVTTAIAVFLLLAAGFAYLLFLGWAPAAMFVLFGLAAGIPGGALMALTSEAVSTGNRGPGLGVHFTWYYAGMTVAPAAAGWLRDTVQHAGAPVIFAGALTLATVLTVLLLRLLQARWPIQRSTVQPG
jgi:predicted MFS family arabinose efflux permease